MSSIPVKSAIFILCVCMCEEKVVLNLNYDDNFLESQLYLKPSVRLHRVKSWSSLLDHQMQKIRAN